MLAFFLFHLVRLHLMNLFHQLLLGTLHKLQHLNKKVSIVSRNSLLLLRPNPRSINTFRLVRLVLMGRGWPWLCLWGHNTHVSHRLWSRGHNLQGLYLLSLSFSQLPRGVANLKVVGLLCLRLDYSYCTMTLWFWGRRVRTGLVKTHPRLAYAQVGLFLCRRALAGVLSVSRAHGRK